MVHSSIKYPYKQRKNDLKNEDSLVAKNKSSVCWGKCSVTDHITCINVFCMQASNDHTADTKVITIS